MDKHKLKETLQNGKYAYSNKEFRAIMKKDTFKHVNLLMKHYGCRNYAHLLELMVTASFEATFDKE